MFNGNLSIAIAFIEAAAAAIVLSSCACLLLKTRNLRIQKKKAAYLKKHRAYFTYLETHAFDSGELRPPAGRLRSLELRVIQEQLAERIDRLSGGHRDKLTMLCEDMGLIRRNLKRLQSLRRDKRVEAAYYLGMMRSELAVPDLLERMKTENPDPALYIFARAVAKCAMNGQDVGRMVRILLKHKIPAYDLIADILKDARADLSTLYSELLEDPDPAAVRVALASLESRLDIHLSASLLRLVRSSRKTLRYPALKLLVSSGSIQRDAEAASLAEQWDRPAPASSDFRWRDDAAHDPAYPSEEEVRTIG